jgi:large subunit ribosomal protein L5
MVNRLKEKYEKEVAKKMMEEFGTKNRMALPRLSKVVINMGIGDTLKNKEALAAHKRDMAAIAGQAPQIRAARVSVASFTIRRGMHVGLKTTLRGDRMYSFLDKLFSIVLPRLRDFRGVSAKSFDKDGNYTLGFVEHTVFPEIDTTKSQPHGLELTIVVKGGDKEKSFKMLSLLGMPFEK